MAKERASEHGLALRNIDHRDGDALVRQRESLDNAQERERNVREARSGIESQLTAVDIECPTTFDEFAELRSAAAREKSEWEASKAQGTTDYFELHNAYATAKRRLDEIDTELKSLRKHRSNIEHRLIRARQLVADASGLPANVFPFAAELLQVRAEHSEWAGAMERVLRPLATVMLVPEVHIARVREAVDRQHLAARLVFESVPSRPEAPRSPKTKHSIVHRVEVKSGPMEQWLRSALSRQYDYECVDTPAELAGPDLAVTRSGQVKRSRTRHEKDDRSAVDDRSRWILGFDNHDKVEHLLVLRAAAVEEVAAAEQPVIAAQTERQTQVQRVGALEALASLEWRSIDVGAASRVTNERELRLDELLSSNPDLQTAEAAAREAHQRLEDAKAVENGARQELT